MGYKNLGPGVSQSPQSLGLGDSYSAEEKSFESIIIQTDKPVIDWEVNLLNEINNDNGIQLNNRKLFPSHFRMGNFLESSSVNGSYIFLAPAVGTENKFQIVAQDVAVNGWPIRFEYSDIVTVGLNEVTLDIPPVGGNRIDLVILEVWRALVVASPSVVNKSPTGLIVRNGNVKAPDGVNLIDDLIDPTFAAESAARVQIQYRYRVINNVDLSTYPDGLDDPAIVANSVSDFAGPGADGAATVYGFTNSTSDRGLWVAGTGDVISAAALGTVDGYMYAIPVCAVARRNSAAFDRAINLNGGSAIVSAVPTRPDDLYCDQIVDGDIIDLRKGCSSNFQEITDKSLQQLFANSLSTQFEISSEGTLGTSFLYKDDTSGTSLGYPDGVRTYFSDRSITQSVVARIDVVAPSADVTFDLSALTLSWDVTTVDMLAGPINGVSIVQVNKARIVDSVGVTDTDLFDNGNPFYVASIELKTAIAGVDQAKLVFNAPVNNVSIFVELMINYQGGTGIDRNIISTHQLWAPAAVNLPVWVDTSGFLATSDVNREVVPSTSWYVDPSHRELSIFFTTVSQNASVITYDIDRLLLWERLDGSAITITDGTNAPYATTNYTVNTAYTVVTLTGGVAILGGVPVSVDYIALRGLPVVGAPPADSYQLFYQTRAIQSLGPPAGVQTLNLIPRYIQESMYILTQGSGSPDVVLSPILKQISSQIPVASINPDESLESYLDCPRQFYISGDKIQYGFVKIPTSLPYTPDTGSVTLYRDALDPVIDSELRNFWPKSDSGSSSYYPSVSASQLDFSQKHKGVFAVLMELKDDFSSIGKKGTLVLVTVSSWFSYGVDNFAAVAPTLYIGAAGVFRVRGNIINPRRFDQ